MAAQVASERGQELPLRSGEGVKHPTARLALLAIDERMDISVVPLLRRPIRYSGRRTLPEITRQIAASLEKGRVLAEYKGADIQNKDRPIVLEVQLGGDEGVGHESSGL